MTAHKFKVITGGSHTTRPLPFSAALDLGPRELAGNMALLFAMSLLRAKRPTDLEDPHSQIWINERTGFTLHELLCELRNLSWFEARALPSFDLPPVAHDVANGDAKSKRRQASWNDDGQLTLRTIFRGGLGFSENAPRLSPIFQLDTEVSETGGYMPPLSETSDMSSWLSWCAAHSGASLRPQCDQVQPEIQSLGHLSEYIHQAMPSRLFHNAALDALARGAEVDHGLCPDYPASHSWNGPRILNLMAKAEQQAQRLSTDNMMRNRRHYHRPPVTAARMSVHLACQDMSSDKNDTFRQAADELADAAPNLLHWYTQAQDVMRGPQTIEPALFLPLSGTGNAPLHPSDFTSTVMIAGALGTLIKAVFETSPEALRPVRDQGPDRHLEADIDQLVANISLARLVAGGHFPAENYQDLRLGQTIALHLLRDTLGQENRSTQLSFRDFDGRRLTLKAHPRSFGRGHVELLEDGRTIDWPHDKSMPRPNLTAIV